MNKKYELIIFDMDGTILDTIKDITNSVNYTFKHFNLDLKSEDDVKKALGNGAERLIKDLLISKHDNVDQIINFYLDYYTKNNNIYTKPYPNILNVLKQLKKDNYKLAVVSNKSDHLVKELNDNLFENLFDIAIGEQEGLLKKPEPDMLNYVLNYFNIKNDKTLFIGDSEVDVLTGKNTNVDVIAVSWGFRDYDFLKTLNSDYLIKNPLEILKIVDGKYNE